MTPGTSAHTGGEAKGQVPEWGQCGKLWQLLACHKDEEPVQSDKEVNLLCSR